MSLADKLRRLPPVGWAAIFSVFLVFPLLGSFGFWDPWELGLAERAREMVRAERVADATVGGRYGAEPPLDLALSALGMKIFGVRELGARFFNGLFAVLALLAAYWAGAGLFRRRAGLLATLALGTMPLFFLQARQLTSDMPLIAGLTLALGGLGRYAWPGDGRRRPRDLAVAAAGLLLGTLSGGVLIGFALPTLSVLGALVVGWGLRPEPEEAPTPLAARGVGRDVPADKTFGAGLLGSRGKLLLLLIALAGLAALVLALTTANVAGKYSLLLGGTPRGGTPPHKFEYLIRQIGFGVFPWSAIVVFALGRALVRLGNEDGPGSGGRLAFGQLHLLLFAAFGYALTTIFVLMTGEARFAVLAPLALAVGAFLDEALEGERAEPVLGLLAATGTMVVARDFYLAPEELPSLHVLAKVKWPPQLRLQVIFMIVGLIVGLGTYLALATRGRALGKVALRDVSGAGALRRRLEVLVVKVGRWGVHAAVAAAVLFALVVAHGVVPALSKHFSFKPVLESFTRYAKADEALGKYRVEGHGTGFYAAREMVELPTQDRVVEFLRQSKRAFALVASEELAALDAALRLGRVDYFVVDASSSRFLLLSNRIGEGETDQNPLKKNVWMASRPPTPRAGSAASGGSSWVHFAESKFDWPNEAPPWEAPRIRAFAEFGNMIELVGADYPAAVRRPGKIPLTLHFRVNQRPPPGYKVFVHFDSPGDPRILGDHAPLDGAFPTTYWLPGEYIKDHVEIDVPLMTTPAGTYTLYVGLWPGGEQKRVAITAGSGNDGFDRLRVGTIDIR